MYRDNAWPIGTALAVDMATTLAQGGEHELAEWWTVDTTEGAVWTVCRACGYCIVCHPDGTAYGRPLLTPCRIAQVLHPDLTPRK